MMDEKTFNEHIDQILINIENAIEQQSLPLECEQPAAGMLEIEFPNGVVMVINRQTPARQLWLAAKDRGYHFNYRADQWVCDRTQKTLSSVLNEICSQQLGEKVTLVL